MTHVNFSPDDRFLAGCDDQPENSKLCVWDMQNNGGLEAATKQKDISFLTWGPVEASTRKMSQHARYKLYGATAAKMHTFTLDFDVRATPGHAGRGGGGGRVLGGGLRARAAWQRSSAGRALSARARVRCRWG